MIGIFSREASWTLQCSDRVVLPVDDLWIDHRWQVRYLKIGAPDSEPVNDWIISTSVVFLESESPFLLACILPSSQLSIGFRSPEEVGSQDSPTPFNRSQERRIVNRFGWPIYWLGQPPGNHEPQQLLAAGGEGPLWSLMHLFEQAQPIRMAENVDQVVAEAEVSLDYWSVRRLIVATPPSGQRRAIPLEQPDRG